MEVHKHPRHLTHQNQLGEYFLEFLTIFPAVTLGFFAETIREISTEHKRAKEFAASMLKDLQEDTAQLKSYLEYFHMAAVRYFKKPVAAKVAKYDQLCRRIQFDEERQERVYVEVRKSRAQIFDFRYNDIANDITHAVRRTGDYAKVDSFMKTNPAC